MTLDSSSLNKPVSPQEKRSLLKESEHVKGVTSIEDYLRKLDPYRSTTLNWPYPLTTQPASPSVTKQIEPLRKEILQILTTHSFPPQKYLQFSIHCVTKPLYTPASAPRTTLSLIYITDPDSPRAPSAPETFDPARKQISKLLRTNGLKDIHIQIVFANHCFDPTLFEISDENPAKLAFDTVRSDITRIISKLRNKWTMTKVFNVGMTEETAVPTIVVQVAPFTVADWDGMRRQIEGVLMRRGQMSLDVEFIPGRVSRAVTYPEEEDEDLENSKLLIMV
ncbi:hypothetical protein BJX76DRAFT_351065 [Aspergillus varians]